MNTKTHKYIIKAICISLIVGLFTFSIVVVKYPENESRKHLDTLFKLYEE